MQNTRRYPHVIGLKTDPLPTVRIGFVGLGARGRFALKRFSHMPWTKIAALCDVSRDRVAASLRLLQEEGIPEPVSFVGPDGFRTLCGRGDIDLVYICTDWTNHVPVALCAMENGKHAAIEVPAATTLAECWALVDMAEKTRRHCMMLENCVYDFFTLGALEMARQGLFGELLHVEGGYHHFLADAWEEYDNCARLDYNATHKGDLYPTHGLGPACQLLGIHRDDNLKTLVAMQTRSVNGIASMKRCRGVAVPDFQSGDVTLTMISTGKGRTILLQHDVMTPRPYDRMYRVVGTEGYVSRYPVEQFFLSRDRLLSNGIDLAVYDKRRALPAAVAEDLKARYRSPLLPPGLAERARAADGREGMDFLMDWRLVSCLHRGEPLDMDVYDLAEWCSVAELGALSIDRGSAPVEIPDFTRGTWKEVHGPGFSAPADYPDPGADLSLE